MIKSNRLIISAGLLYGLIALGHIPVNIFPYAFDKNAPVHFVLLISVSVLYSLQIIYRQVLYFLPTKILLLVWALVISLFISAIRSPDLIGALTGDTGRYTGVISLLCLLIVAVFHSQFSLGQLHKLIQMYVITIFVISLLGIAQHFKLIDLPGDLGVTGTLGNLDFFGAYVGTGFALFVYLIPHVSRRQQFVYAGFILVELYAVYLAGPLQSYVDIAIILLALTGYFFRARLPIYELTLNAKTFFATIGIIIWLEGIFLMPFLGSFIPVLGNDPQVQIRGQFWLAATRQFTSSPLTGVGPDQYGNFYDLYRTESSVQQYPQLLANDAHGAPAQTLATLGIFGTIAFVLLLALLVRSFFIIDKRSKKNRIAYLSIALYLFVFITNSAVSPITLPHKYLFWAIAGVVVGNAYRGNLYQISINNLRRVNCLVLVLTLMVPSFYVLLNFIPAQYRFLVASQSFSKNAEPIPAIRYNNYLPCLIYYPTIATILNQKSEKDLIIYSQDQINGNPYCIDAWINLAKIANNQGDLPTMRTIIYKLIEIAPTRGEVINLAALYANKANDKTLNELVNRQLLKLNPGLVIIE